MAFGKRACFVLVITMVSGASSLAFDASIPPEVFQRLTGVGNLIGIVPGETRVAADIKMCTTSAHLFVNLALSPTAQGKPKGLTWHVTRQADGSLGIVMDGSDQSRHEVRNALIDRINQALVTECKVLGSKQQEFAPVFSIDGMRSLADVLAWQGSDQ